MVRRTSVGGSRPLGQGPGRLLERTEAVGGQLVEAGLGGLVGAASSSSVAPVGSMTTLSMSTTRWRQWSKAASWPMTARMASGWPRSSGGVSGRCSTSRTTS